MTCIVQSCDRPPRTKGLCDAHYMRKRTYGDLREDTPVSKNVKHKSVPQCTVEYCDIKYYASGYCKSHYERVRRTGSAGTKVVKNKPKQVLYVGCSVDGCERKHYARAMCQTHYNHNFLFNRN